MNPEEIVYMEDEFTYSPKRMEQALRNTTLFLKSQQVIWSIMGIAIFIYIVFSYFLLRAYESYRFFIFFMAAMVFFVRVIAWFGTRNGGIQYKRLLSTNNGNPPRTRIRFTDTAIEILSLDNGNHNQLSLSLVRSIYETEDMVLILLQHNQFVPLDKHTLTGGTPEELAAFLAQRCPQMKPRKLRSRLPGQIISYSPVVLVILGVLLALLPC